LKLIVGTGGGEFNYGSKKNSVTKSSTVRLGLLLLKRAMPKMLF